MAHTTVINHVQQRQYAFAEERNDCTVRALANASGISYYDAYAAFQKAGRKSNRGTRYNVWAPLYKSFGFNKMVAYGETGGVYKRSIEMAVKGMDVEATNGMTLGRFIKANPVGTFIVIVRKHALCVKDGVVYDSHKTAPGTRVVCTLTKGGAVAAEPVVAKKAGFDKKAYMKAYNARKAAAKAGV